MSDREETLQLENETWDAVKQRESDLRRIADRGVVSEADKRLAQAVVLFVLGMIVRRRATALEDPTNE